MSVERPFLVSAQWLNEHLVTISLGIAMLAFATEYLCRLGETPGRSRATWARTWLVNVTLFASAIAVSWLLAPWLSPAFGAALSSRAGLLDALGVATMPYPLYVLAGVLLLDLQAYAIHRAMHAIPWLWRLHLVHHSDEHMNASTHFRQHPVQIVAVALIQLPTLWLLGIPAVSWVFYAATGVPAQLWQHSARTSSPTLEAALRYLMVTPTMHRVHHDTRRQFHDTNYGALFPFWDRMFGTYQTSSPDSRTGLQFTVSSHNDDGLSLADCLLLPFRSSTAQDSSSGEPGFQTPPQGRT